MRNTGTCCELAQGRTHELSNKDESHLPSCHGPQLHPPSKAGRTKPPSRILNSQEKKKMQRWPKGKHLPLLLSSSPLPTDPGCHCESCPLPCISGQHVLAMPAGNVSHGLCPTQQLTTRPHPSEIHCRNSPPWGPSNTPSTKGSTFVTAQQSGVSNLFFITSPRSGR